MAQAPRISIETDEQNQESTYRQLKLDLALAARRWRRRYAASRRLRGRSADLQERQIAGDAGDEVLASLDQLVRSLLALGASRRDIALEIVRTTPCRDD